MCVVVSKQYKYNAYGTLCWGTIDATFCRRRLPKPLRDAYWRMHRGRELRVRTPGGAVAFSVVPTQGISMGAPESPLVYAAVMEDLVEDAEEGASGRRPPGRLDAALNFADDTCLLARHARMLEYELTVLRRVTLRAGHRLNANKCEILFEADAAEKPRARPDRELGEYRKTGSFPDAAADASGQERVAAVDEMTVLGTVVT